MIEAKQLVDIGILGDVNYVQAQWFWNMKPLAANRPLKGKLDWHRSAVRTASSSLIPRNTRGFLIGVISGISPAAT